MIKVKINRGRNSPPIDKTPVEFNTQSKVSGLGLSTPDNSIGPAGDPFRGGSSQPRHAMEEKEDYGCGCEECGDGEELIKYFDMLDPQEQLDESLIYEKKDRCYYLAKQKYDVFPSAYASGFIVRCRKGKVGRKRKKRKNEEITLEEIELSEGTFDKEEDEGLRGWFGRRGERGKKKGWVDCNTCRKDPETGRKTCKTCGRQEGEKRSKYPACRPTPAACTRKGTSSKRGPTRVSWKKKKEEE
jgi:hypothetical protein